MQCHSLPRIIIMWILLLYILPLSVNSQLLEIFGLSTGEAGTKADRQPFHDLASQSVGLINYLQTVQRNPDNQLAKKLKEPLPTVNFIEGLPILPGVTGSLPGAGACLPRGAPLVRDKSPSLFQNFLRNIPGAQDYLSKLIPAPTIDVRALYGKYLWALDTPSVHDRYCATTEVLAAAEAGNSSSFSIQEKFRTGSERGGEKVAFGYGIIHKEQTYVYMQDDPCPYQIIIAGPKHSSGQYEYVILSNWARFPIIGLVRDIRTFYKDFKDKMEDELEREGFINDYAGSSNIHYADWSKCRPATPVSYIQNVLSDLFGK